ncbi:MAG: hypothetical protein WBA74_09965 [Cyclobacteriaceae bacterium]
MKWLAILILITLAACTPDTGDICSKTTCSDYQTQQEAQEDFDLNPDCRANLDRDRDSIPCEHLPDSIRIR